MMTRSVSLRVKLLGPLEVELDGRPVAPPPSRRAWALLGYFALRPGPMPRSDVASAFWPDVLDGSARASLRSAVWSLRRALGEAAGDRLVTTRDAVGLADDRCLWTDLRAFTQAADSGRQEEALALCRGPLLQGVEDDWAIVARDEVAERVGELLGALADAARRRGDSAEALRWARRRTAAAPLDEAAARALMLTLAAAEDRAAALEVYRRLAQRLQRELGVAPAAATREVAQRLQAPPAPSAAVRSCSEQRLLGRERELSELDAIRHRLHRGAATALVIGGEAGIGKTALAGELLRRLAARGCRIAACTGSGLERPAPYAQWAELVRELHGAGDLFGDAIGRDQAPPGLARARLREHAVDLLEQLTAAAPVALLLDDAHAVDAWSLELAGYVARRLRDRPLLLALTRRHLPRRADLDALTYRLEASGVELRTLQLGPLDHPSAAQLVRARSRLDERGVQQAVLLADGNPLLALETARALERGEQASAGLRAMVRAAIGRLPDPARDIVELVAVAGGELRAPDLLELGTLEAVERAFDTGLLAATDSLVQFRHGLLREAVYEEIAQPRRAALHGRAAELAGAPAEQAQHLRLAGRDRLAAEALVAAADRALALGEVDEAASLLNDALGIDADDPRLHLRLARTEAWRSDASAAEAAFRRALRALDPRDHGGRADAWLQASVWYRSSLCDPRRTLDAADHALRYVGEDADRRADALAARAWAGAMLGVLDDAERDVAAAAALDSDGRLAFDVALVRAHVLVCRGRPQESLEAFQDAAAAARPAGRPDLAYGVWTHAAAVAAFAGDLDRALAYVERCLEEAGHITHLRVPALAARGYVLARLGRHREAALDAARQLELAVVLEDGSLRAVAEHDAGMIALAGGRHGAAVAHLSAALDARAEVSRPAALLARAEAYARMGRPDAAEADAREVVLLPLRAVDAPAALVPRLTWIQGLAEAARGDAAAARQHLSDAAAGWRRMLSTGEDAPIEAWVANILDLGRPPAAGLVEPARELARTLADLAAIDAEAAA